MNWLGFFRMASFLSGVILGFYGIYWAGDLEHFRAACCFVVSVVLFSIWHGIGG